MEDRLAEFEKELENKYYCNNCFESFEMPRHIHVGKGIDGERVCPKCSSTDIEYIAERSSLKEGDI